MKAILFSGRTVIGTHMDPPIEEMERLGTQYILVEEIPEIILTCPPTHYVELVEGEYVLVEIPVTPHEPSETEILQERLTLVESMLIEIIYGGVQ